jgi:dTDP-4-amino-4,6-dideoxygalactose transaminase
MVCVGDYSIFKIRKKKSDKEHFRRMIGGEGRSSGEKRQKEDTEKMSAAFLDGTPATFEDQITVGKPHVRDVEGCLKLIEGALRTGQLTNGGPLVHLLEERLKKFLGVRHAICVCNATIGLHIGVLAMLGPCTDLRNEVLVPSWTFVATAHAVMQAGYKPIFVDCEKDTHLLDTALLESLITSRTRAIIGVHVWGRLCHVEKLDKICKKYHLKLMFDSAHAFACGVGGFGDCEVFSFHATKFYGSCEGGVITTNDSSLAAELRLLRNFGFAGEDLVVSLGTNAKMSEVHAAVGVVNLDHIEKTLAACKESFFVYAENLKNIPGLKMLRPDLVQEKYNFQYVVLDIDQTAFGLSRDRLVEFLLAENVRARKYFKPGVHRMAPYSGQEYSEQKNSEGLCETCIVLPAGALLPEKAEKIASLVQLARARATEITQK